MPDPTTRLRLAVLGGPGWLTLGATTTVALAALLPWARGDGETVLGVEGDGRITLVLGVLGAVLGLVGTPALGRVLVRRDLALGLSAAMVALGLLVTAAVGDTIAGVPGADHAVGWLLTAAGLLLWGAALIWDVVSDRSG